MAGGRRLPWPEHVKVGGVSLLCHKAPGLYDFFRSCGHEGKLIMGDGRISHGYFMFMSHLLLMEGLTGRWQLVAVLFPA